jgi:hypothetical protein
MMRASTKVVLRLAAGPAARTGERGIAGLHSDASDPTTAPVRYARRCGSLGVDRYGPRSAQQPVQGGPAGGAHGTASWATRGSSVALTACCFSARMPSALYPAQGERRWPQGLVADGASRRHAPRFPDPLGRELRSNRPQRRCLAAARQLQPHRREQVGGEHRGRPEANHPGAGHHRALARTARFCRSSHRAADCRGGGRGCGRYPRPCARPKPRHAQGVAGGNRRMHASRLHPDVARCWGSHAKLRGLGLPVPLFAVRHLRPRAARPRAEQSRAAPLPLQGRRYAGRRIIAAGDNHRRQVLSRDLPKDIRPSMRSRRAPA